MSNNNRSRFIRNHRPQESGFTLLEMVVAMLVLTIGLLGVASAIGYSLMASNRGRGITNQKMLIVSTLEQMEMLRDTGQLNFQEISNSHVANSTFTYFPGPPNFYPVSTIPGPDGIFGTSDDLMSPGPDGFYGTTDDGTAPDPTLARPGVQRMIEITQINPLLKKIKVTLRPNSSATDATQDLVGISYLNDDAHSNYIP